MCERLPFLKEKAENFRAFVLGQNPDAELTAQIETFRPEMLLPTLTTVLLPAIGVKGIEGVVDDLMAHLTPTDAVAVKGKLLRYIKCFYEVLFE
jgi:hypothetical protein